MEPAFDGLKYIGPINLHHIHDNDICHILHTIVKAVHIYDRPPCI